MFYIIFSDYWWKMWRNFAVIVLVGQMVLMTFFTENLSGNYDIQMV